MTEPRDPEGLNYANKGVLGDTEVTEDEVDFALGRNVDLLRVASRVAKHHELSLERAIELVLEVW